MSAARAVRGLAAALGVAVAIVAASGRAEDAPAPEAAVDAAEEAPVEPAEEEAPPYEVSVDGDRVTATFSGIAPDVIVREIAAAAGAEVVGGADAADPTSVDFDDVPIDRALERALGGQSFTIVYGADGRVRRIRLHGGPQEGPPAGEQVAARKATSAGGGIAPHQLFDVEVPIPSVGPLAEHLGTQTATLGQLYRIAVDQDEAALRIGAVDAAMAAIEGDTNLQGSVDAMLDGTDDAALAAVVQGSAGKRANELVSRILSRTRRPQVRQRAVTLLRQLRQPPPS